ncbi:MAG: hypothetical protein J7K65_08935, partial [Planctomycetes bacterium]|nr:hypothetical protein [Planctomycetota bacterium]
AELVTCQQEKGTLQGQLDQANTTITEKNTNIEALKAEHAEMETKTMESITLMMTKQAAKDKELKEKLAQKEREVTYLRKTNDEFKEKVVSLEAQIAKHACATPKAEVTEKVEE